MPSDAEHPRGITMRRKNTEEIIAEIWASDSTEAVIGVLEKDQMLSPSLPPAEAVAASSASPKKMGGGGTAPAEAPLSPPGSPKSLAELVAEANATDRKQRNRARLRPATQTQARAQLDAERKWAKDAQKSPRAKSPRADCDVRNGQVVIASSVLPFCAPTVAPVGIVSSLKEILFQAQLDRQEREEERRAHADARAIALAARSPSSPRGAKSVRLAAGGLDMGAGSCYKVEEGKRYPPYRLRSDSGNPSARCAPDGTNFENESSWSMLHRLRSWEGPFFGASYRNDDEEDVSDDDFDGRTNQSAPVGPINARYVEEIGVTLEAEDPSDLEEFPYILSPSQMSRIAVSALPNVLTYHRWRRSFSLARDGDAFDTFLRLAGDARRTLLVVRDTGGDVFGAYADSPWTESRRGKFHGSALACLWAVRCDRSWREGQCDADADESVEVYKWTGANRYIQLMDVGTKMIAFGGGGKAGGFGLCIEDDFRRGSTGPCTTFQNDSLCGQQHFKIVDMECWTFHPGFA